MTFRCRLKIRSHVDHGDIMIGEESHSLSKKIYEYEFTSLGSREKILSLKNLAPGLDEGVELISCEIDGLLLSNPEEFTSFQMLDNPYVDNRLIKERNLVFNGDLEFKIDKDKLYWFPTYYSKNKIDFVYQNNLATCQGVEGCWQDEKTEHLSGATNIPYDPSVKPEVNDKFALGCSVTYGTAVDRTQTWPALLGYENFGVPGAGVDAIFYNAYKIVELFKPKTMIIMFPDMSRRMLEFERKGHFFRMPITSSTRGFLTGDFNQGTFPLRPNFWIGSKEINELVLQRERQMVEDENNDHSKHYLQKISALPCDIRVSSYNLETYKILPNYFKNVLPFFNSLDKALDDSHPGPLSHKNWVEELKNHNI
jgi:hypothetical protein